MRMSDWSSDVCSSDLLTGALRTDENSRFKGRSNTKTIGLEFRPLRSLLLRASYSDAYKPLPLYGAAQDPIGYLIPISDPQMGGQQYAVEENLVSGGISSGLKTETSATRRVGLVYAPGNGRGLVRRRAVSGTKGSDS